MIWTVPKMWDGETCFILAGGPSLTGFDASVLGSRRVLTINDSWRIAPERSINYYCDGLFWTSQIGLNRWSLGMTRSFHDQIYKGFWVTSAPGFEDHPQVHALRLTGQRGLELDPTGLRHGSNSGYQAINLAYHLGAKRIVLLGYDMGCDGPRTHWHEEPRDPAASFSVTLEKSFLPHFETLAEPLRSAGVEVINATPRSALTVWPRVPLEEILETRSSTAKGD